MWQDFATVSFANPVNEFTAALDWLSELGVCYSASRIGLYKQTLSELESERLRGSNLYACAKRLNAFAPLFEANELIVIHQGLAGTGLDAYLLPRLKELVSGPYSYVDEDAASANKARTFGFELALMARLAKSGLSIRDGGLADIFACLGNVSFIVECKRPQSLSRVSDMIRYARRQLDTRFRQLRTENVAGFIAFDLTKILNPEMQIADNVPISQVISRINADMEDFVIRYESDWNRVRDQRVVGVLLRYSVLAWAERTRVLSWVHRYGVTPFSGRAADQVSAVTTVRNALDRLVFNEGAPLVGGVI